MTRKIDPTKRRQAGAGRVELQVDAMGNPLCRNCGTPVPAGRKTFCQESCVHEWKMTTSPTYVRGLVFKRDRGICSQCGWDAESAHKIYLDLWHGHCVNNRSTVYGAHLLGLKMVPPELDLKNWYDMLTKRGHKLPALDFSEGMAAHEWLEGWGHGKARILSFWENDHIQRVVEGAGVTFDLSALQTLCRSCHLKKTLKQRKERGS